ncbi:hypothetical protein SCA03_29690 [Streptomyces cacaoi]|uniref:Uncharacterized protein n=1 Tax=Streptomyces cacaoi TaxID=1898 RepID=A0A4Y3R158_STRCI|nr:hypothetical protein SCA03_29690 [Streptomyces cacaoi]
MREEYFTYQVEYATPRAIPGDGFEWVTHTSVTCRVRIKALRAARADAARLRKWHSKVRITRNGETVR